MGLDPLDPVVFIFWDKTSKLCDLRSVFRRRFSQGFFCVTLKEKNRIRSGKQNVIKMPGTPESNHKIADQGQEAIR
ncbi:hypothetical protein B9G55_14125 [Saccharibacillus sp. O16]|nr:hypothetical protein B9G55_14125 [Saccharibacillus sp. O16]